MSQPKRMRLQLAPEPRLSEQWTRLAAARARSLSRGLGIEYELALSDAYLGLVKAEERYDASRGFAFSSFATSYIDGEIRNQHRNRATETGTCNRTLWEDRGKIKKARRDLVALWGREPTTHELAERTGLSIRRLQRGLAPVEPIRLDRNTGDKENSPLYETVGTEDSGYDLVDALDLIARLPRVERMVVEELSKGYTQTQVARTLGCSQTNVGHILGRVRRKLIRDAA